MSNNNLSELIANEIKIADNRFKCFTTLPCGNYTANDLHRLKLACNPSYVEDNMELPNTDVRVIRENDGWFSIPEGNIFYVLNKHEDLAGLDENARHLWERKGRGKCVQTLNVIFPDKEMMKTLSAKLWNNPSGKRGIAFSTYDGKLRCFTDNGKRIELQCPGYAPNTTIGNEVFVFTCMQAEQLYGPCQLKYYEGHRPNKNQGNPLGKRILIANKDKRKVGSETLIATDAYERLMSCVVDNNGVI